MFAPPIDAHGEKSSQRRPVGAMIFSILSFVLYGRQPYGLGQDLVLRRGHCFALAIHVIEHQVVEQYAP